MKTFLLQSIHTLNTSKYFAGMMMLILNLGSRFLVMELSESQEQLLSNKVIRRFVIFTVVFISSRDILVSLVVTAVFIVLVSGIFNENSKYCIVTKPVIQQVKEDDYKEAKKIVKFNKIDESVKYIYYTDDSIKWNLQQNNWLDVKVVYTNKGDYAYTCTEEGGTTKF